MINTTGMNWKLVLLWTLCTAGSCIVAGVLDDPYSQLVLLSGVAVLVLDYICKTVICLTCGRHRTL
jgi:hypothetical protein